MIKGLHFGIIYGMSKKSLYIKLRSEGVDISRQRSDDLWDRYFARFRRVRAYIEYLREFAEANGYTETIFGFRRPIHAGEMEEGGRATFWGNQAINSPIQGSAHQLLLCGMALLNQKPVTYHELQRPVMNVHDALVFYNTGKLLEETFRQGKKLLEHAIPDYVEKEFGFKLRVPIEAECKAGFRLGSLAKYKGTNVKEFLPIWRERNRMVEHEINSKWLHQTLAA
jgi:DNA polymerase-1